MLESLDPNSRFLPQELIVDLTDIAVVPSQDEQQLDEASQTGDFSLPDTIYPIEALTDYEMLLYRYADGREVEVYHPISLSIRCDGAEQITCADRVGITVPPGYLQRESFPKFGKACFPGHKPVHTLGGE